MNINIVNRTAEEWSQAHAGASALYAMLVASVGISLQFAGVASGETLVAVALVGYVLLTAHFVNQIFIQTNDE